ncbi:PKD domain-containing protein [Litoribacter ruber]|uniref:PKD domain-containing protein n=1 Tax=Litoribacter ruber TaxID=702568 RepID=A0AAP2G5V6_9BACT|nr:MULTISPECIES: PKD domain-containing protein [Litoribacter]MBS9524978.1 PKD domain-containing protein [Litoribacter alkaliphilus]MBT0811862.1 PKD domain-containing protein [Litoribacter ruber]
MKLRLLFTTALAAAVFSCDTGENVPSSPADFEFSQEMFMVRQEVQFSDVPSGAAKYEWKFGEGGVSDARTPRFSFNNPGVYPVTLQVTTAGPETHSATKEIRIGQYYINQLSLEGVQNDYEVKDGLTELYVVVSRRMEDLEEVDRVDGLSADLNNLPATFDLDEVMFDAGPEYSVLRVYDASDDSLVAIHDQFEAASAFGDVQPTGEYDHEIRSSSSLGSRMVLRYNEGE